MVAQHIVHVEDDKPLRKILGVALHAADPSIDMHQFVNAEEAFCYIALHWQTIDLFVLDIRLPGMMNGLQLAQKIRDLNCPGYIIMTSAYNTPSSTLLKGLRAEYYSKPWHLMEITERLIGYRLSRPILEIVASGITTIFSRPLIVAAQPKIIEKL